MSMGKPGLAGMPVAGQQVPIAVLTLGIAPGRRHAEPPRAAKPPATKPATAPLPAAKPPVATPLPTAKATRSE